MPSAIVLTPRAGYEERWAWAYDVEAEALEAGGIAVTPRPWNAIGEWRGHDLVLPLVAWGYSDQPDEWFALLDRLEREGAPVVNPVPVLRWSSDKRYLAELAAAGVATIPTRLADALDDGALAAARDEWGNELVVKPRISAGAVDTYRLGSAGTVPEAVRGRAMMIQPFLPAVAEEGEYSLMFFGGSFSHAIVKRPAAGDYRVQPQHGGREQPCAPPDGAIALAKAALAVAPGEPAYARVDLIRGTDGALKVIELELVEPSLWLQHAPDRGASFVAAIAERARQ